MAKFKPPKRKRSNNGRNADFTTRRVAYSIVEAFTASRNAKIIDMSKLTYRQRKELGYSQKIVNIKTALNILSSARNESFKYYVKEALDQNDQPCVIVYFECLAFETWHQISFHIPMWLAEETEINKFVNTTDVIERRYENAVDVIRAIRDDYDIYELAA